MKLLRVAVGPHPHVSLLFPTAQQQTMYEPLVVVGPNGSGKSLLVMGLLAALADDANRPKWLDALREGGLGEVEVVYAVGDDIIRFVRHLTTDNATTNLERLIEFPTGGNGRPQPHSIKLPNEVAGEMEVFRTSRLFPLVHVLLGGRAMLPADSILREAAVEVVCSSVDTELAGWLARERQLTGDAESAGSLAASLSEVEAAERELHRVEALWQVLERDQDRRKELEGQLAQTRNERKVLVAEAEEVAQLCALSERARRLETWLSEIERDSEKVAELRRRHSELQTRLDVLEAKFRGAPENLPDLLDEYERCRARESELADRLKSLTGNRETQKTRLEQVRLELARLESPRDVTAELETAREEAARLNNELTELLRGRIELVRKREGAHQRLQQEFAPFLELEGPARKALDELVTLDPAQLVESAVPQPDSATRQREIRGEEIRAHLRDRYAGFENLPDQTAERLRDLFQARAAVFSFTADLEAIVRQREELRRKVRPWLGAVGAMVTGGVGFALGTYLSGWEVGIILALAASGVTLLGLRSVQRRVEADLESVAQAEAMLRQRIAAAGDKVARLERVLAPLAEITTLEGALARLAEHQRYRAELDGIAFDADLHGTTHTHPLSPTLRRILEHLPPELSDTPLKVIRKLYESYLQLAKSARELDDRWERYSDGGSHVLQIRELEDQVSRLNRKQSELTERSQRARELFESRKAALASEADELARAVSRDASAAVASELEQTTGRIAELDQLTGALLSKADAAILREEWRERETLRTKLREVRNELSVGQSHDELRAREGLLREEAAEARQKLSARDPLYLHQGNTAEYSAKYQVQRRTLQEAIESCNQRESAAQRERDAIDTDSRIAALAEEPDLKELRRLLAEHKLRVEEIQRDLTTTRELVASIRSEREQRVRNIGSELQENMDRIVCELTEKRFRSVRIQEGEWIAAAGDGQPRRLTSLSDGTQDILLLAARLGILFTLKGSDEDPVVWDEALWRLDEDHLERMKKILSRLSADRQVILLTRQSEFESWGPSVRIGEESRKGARRT
ncbi:hypothetical protein KKH27_10875 [bacterium]|nr:hypothetical protein [bacterium]MBU1983581.1 hypothetical protein [bacterium]